MLKSGKILRFTPAEIAEARLLGLDLSPVRTQEEFTDALLELITTLARERPALLEHIAKALAAATGRKLPAQVTVIK